MKVVALCPELRPTIVARSSSWCLTEQVSPSKRHATGILKVPAGCSSTPRRWRCCTDGPSASVLLRSELCPCAGRRRMRQT